MNETVLRAPFVDSFVDACGKAVEAHEILNRLRYNFLATWLALAYNRATEKALKKSSRGGDFMYIICTKLQNVECLYD